MKNLTRFVLTALLLTLGSLPTFAQTAPTSTTLAAAITGAADQQMTVSSATGFTATTSAQQYLAMIDRELVNIRAINSTVIGISRGQGGTAASPHASGATVVTAAAQAFVRPINGVIKPGASLGASCTSANEAYLPLYDPANGRRYNCIGSLWMVDNGLALLPPSACITTVSGNGSGTNGLTIAGASNTGVVQASTSSTGTNTHTYVCTLNAAAWNGSTAAQARNVFLMDATFFYGVQTTALGTQVATLASGTLNSVAVFTSIALPAAGAAETASTVTPVRADAGSMTITPAVASFNTATTTAGGFYSAKFTPATPFALNTDLKTYLFTVTLLNTATSATITNSPGVLVHFAYIPD